MKDEIEQALASAVKELFSEDAAVELTRPDAQFGDWTTNVALKIASKQGKNPREIAEEIKTHLTNLQGRSLKILEAVTVAGPGFLNFSLSDESLLANLEAEPKKMLVGQKIIVEYSDPNPFKPLHAGHLYTTLVGDMIARLVEQAGAETVRINYGGDVGLHVARSMWAIIRELGGEWPDKLNDVPEKDRTKWLGERYVEGTSAYENDATVKVEIVEANKRVYHLHAADDHESPFARIYWTCRQWSYDYFPELYKQLQVKPFARTIPESEITPLGVQIVREQLLKGVYAESDGAVIFRGERFGLHTRVFINSHGLPTYETKDVGLSLTKWRDYHFDESVIITANEQAQYMQVVLASISQFAPEPANRTKHLTHGVVKLQGGEKMSSRKGNVVTALEILEAAREAGKKAGTNPSEETILAAVKYAFAKNRMGGDIIYDPKESIALEGSSGPYLQYAHARARSILVKAGSDILTDAGGGKLEAGERALVRKISEYPETVELATKELMPHHICTYLYELAQEFNRFYEHNRVIGDERQNLRLKLVGVYAGTLKNGLNILGITAPERM